MTKQDIINELKGVSNYKIKFYKQSPYQKNRYKPEFIESEAWIYTSASKYGYCITTESFNDIEYRKNYFNMIRAELKTFV